MEICALFSLRKPILGWVCMPPIETVQAAMCFRLG
jgi:hypothetical protein